MIGTKQRRDTVMQVGRVRVLTGHDDWQQLPTVGELTDLVCLMTIDEGKARYNVIPTSIHINYYFYFYYSFLFLNFKVPEEVEIPEVKN